MPEERNSDPEVGAPQVAPVLQPTAAGVVLNDGCPIGPGLKRFRGSTVKTRAMKPWNSAM